MFTDDSSRNSQTSWYVRKIVMKIVQEVTKWPDNTPNHQYMIADDGKLIAYRRKSDDDWTMFSKKLMFSESRRKFKKLFE